MREKNQIKTQFSNLGCFKIASRSTVLGEKITMKEGFRREQLQRFRVNWILFKDVTVIYGCNESYNGCE